MSLGLSRVPWYLGWAMTASSRRGFTLLEVIIGLAILAIALVGIVSALFSSMRLQQAAREQSLASAALQRTLEEMRTSGAWLEIFRRYNSTNADDPGLAGAIPGARFAVDGLTPLAADADQMEGRILLPEDPTVPSQLKENLNFSPWGFPAGMDLTGDGVIDANNHATDYVLLPVRIVIEWRSGAGGNRGRIEVATILYSKGS